MKRYRSAARTLAVMSALALAAACDDPADEGARLEGRYALVRIGSFEVPLLLLSVPASQAPVPLPEECSGPEDSVDVWLDGALLALLDGGEAEVAVRTRYALGCLPPFLEIGDTIATTGTWTAQGDELVLELADSIPLTENVWLSPEGEWTGSLIDDDRLNVHVQSSLFNIVLEFERD